MDAPCPPPSQLPDPLKTALCLLEQLTINAASVQHRLLCDILYQNSHSEYLRKLFGSDPCSPGPPLQQPPSDAHRPPPVDLLTFKKLAPLSCYEDLEPFIDRIAAGETSPILSGHPVIVLFKSSGTASGKIKFLPGIERDVERSKLIATRRMAVISRNIIEDPRDGKQMLFYFVRPDEWTASGVPKQVLSHFHLKSAWSQPHFKNTLASPREVVLGCKDVWQSTYLQLLCGIIQRDKVVCVGALFAAGMIHVLHVLRKKWRELVKDIRSGCLNTDEVLDQSVCKAVEALMKGPNPALAIQVEEECTREPLWKGIVPRLWPHAQYVSCTVSGSMEHYISELEFCTGELPLVSMFYAGSEGFHGINMNPLCSPHEVSYTMLPDMAYFEFLPVDAQERDQSSLVSLVDVELGKEYEIVVTTFAGLYRFKVGDILRVTGFYNNTPQFQFVGRKNVLLSVRFDKTDEATLGQAVQVARVGHLEAAGRLQLVDYTSYSDPSTFPGHYVLFWELVASNGECTGSVGETPSFKWESPSQGTGEVPSALLLSVLEECCMAMENCFDDVMYRKMRKLGTVGPLEIRVVKEGTFRAFMEYYVGARGVSVGQFKTPRVIKLPAMIEFFNSKVSCCVKART